MTQKHEIHLASNENMVSLKPGSIHLTVTSPPYVTTEFFRGQEFNYEDFILDFKSKCVLIFNATVPGGRFALNVADIITKYRFKDENGLMARAPLGADCLKAAEAAGFTLVERFIWDKGFTRNFKGPLLGSYPYPITLYNNNYFEYIYILAKPGRRKVSQEKREKSKITLDEWRMWTQQWWRVESITEKFNYHRAIFPIEIPYRLIRMYSYEGDTVLDPYAGTAATMIAAHNSNRSSIGYEIDPKCSELIDHRIRFESKAGRIRNPEGLIFSFSQGDTNAS